jgi:gliding motility-associated-like protein
MQHIYFHKKHLFLFTAVLFGLLVSNKLAIGQLSVSSGYTANELAQSMVGDGIEVQNATLNCPTDASGKFDGTASNIALDSGIILTSGSVFNAPGPNNNTGITTDNSAPGDPDLDTLAQANTNDACVLEFDIIPDGDTARFNYVFGSDEYPEYACGNFNDAFGFFISGPGIAGKDNMALVPGTNTPVAINSVTSGSAGSFGDPANCDSMDLNWQSYDIYYVDNSNGNTVEYDGFTVPLTAKHWVSPCDTYHLKLAIADAGDYAYDSGVFLEGESLTSGNVSLDAYSESNSVFPTAIEGCVRGYLKFSISDTLSDSLFINYDIGGTATNGVDYATIPDSVTIPPGDTSTTISIWPYDDAISDSGEYIKIYLKTQCTGQIYDSASLIINEQFEVVVPEDTTICDADSVRLQAFGGNKFQWFPEAGLSDTSIADPMANPDTTTTYIVQSWTDTCSGFDTVTIAVDTLSVQAPDVPPLCKGDSVQLSATGASNYNWQPNYNISDPTVANPYVYPDSTMFYEVTGSAPGCQPDNDFVLINVDSLPESNLAFQDTTICRKQETILALDSNEQYTYQWTPSQGLTCVNCPTPLAQPDSPTTYTVYVTDTNTSCNSEDSAHIALFPPTSPNAGPNERYCTGESVKIGPPSSNPDYQYYWSPDNGLSDTAVPNPSVSLTNPSNSTNQRDYILTIVDTNNCKYSDTVQVAIDPSPDVDAGPDKSLKLNSQGAVTLSGQSNVADVLWTPNEHLSNPNILEPEASPKQSTDYVLTATTSQGCVASDTMTLLVTGIAVPNAFTPNGDGANDEFTIYGASIQKYDLKIYNRWGELLFHSTSINNHWDGTNQNGAPQPAGTYVYSVNALFKNGNDVQKRGNVTLIR